MFINRRRVIQAGGLGLAALAPLVGGGGRTNLEEFGGSLGETQTRGTDRPDTPLLHFPPPVPPSHAYANLVQTSGAIGTTSRLIIPQSAARRNFLAVRNASPAAEVIFVSFNVEATTSSWLRLSANQIALFDTVVPQDNVYVICDAGTGIVSYAFAVLPTFIFHDEATKVAEMRRKQDFLVGLQPEAARSPMRQRRENELALRTPRLLRRS